MQVMEDQLGSGTHRSTGAEAADLLLLLGVRSLHDQGRSGDE